MPKSTRKNECDSCNCNQESEDASAGHEIILPRTKFSWVDEGSTTRRRSHCFSGMSASSIARILLEIGRMPQSSPCQCGGIWGAFTGVAGGTSSLLHTLI